MKKIAIATLTALVLATTSISAIAEEDTAVAVESAEEGSFVWIDSAEGPAFKLYNPSVDMIFFSVERSNPYSEQEMEHEATEKDGLPWMDRVANCKSLTVYDEFADCMFRPWRYGY